MSDDIVSLKIDQNLVKSALEKKIQAEVVASLGNPEVLIAEVVKLALRQKVNAQGKAESSYYDKFDLIEVLCSQAISKAAQEAVSGWVNENKEKIKSAVLKEMKKPQRVQAIALAFANAAEKSIEQAFKVDVKIEFPEVPKSSRY